MSDHAIGQPILKSWLAQSVLSCSSVSTCMLLAETLFQNRNETNELGALETQIRFQKLLAALFQQFRLAGAANGQRLEVQRSIEYVNELFYEPLTIEVLSSMTDISRWRYTQLFKELTGDIPIDYLNAIRIEKAQMLLLTTDDKLYDIAQAVGYSNEYYFNRKFKQSVGITPGQYRTTYQSGSRIFAPFLEDYLLALDIVPVMQYSHKQWGRQEYLGLQGVPEFDVTADDWSALQKHKPALTLLDNGYEKWSLDKCSGISPVFKLPYSGEDWRLKLQACGSIFGRQEKAAQAIQEHENKIAEARIRLAHTVKDESVAVLRIDSRAIYLYGGHAHGYTGPLLYHSLGLSQPRLLQQLAQDKRRINISVEELSSLDADHLFITFEREEGHQTGRELLRTAAWNRVKAVKKNQVYEVDFLAWMNYGVLAQNRKIDDVLQILG